MRNFSNFLVVFVFAVVVSLSFVKGEQYIVGDDEGWNSGVDYYTWLDGKTFHVGDVLVFNYDATTHNVVLTNEDGYANCKAEPNLGALQSGHDIATLTKPGTFYYICEFHCDYSDQKIEVVVN